MNDSMAQPHPGFRALELPGWKTAAAWVGAVLVGLLFLVSGIWKITDVQGAAMRMTQVHIPASLSVAAALGIGIVETAAGVFVIVPRFRRWGAILTGILLLAFMIFVGANYHVLRGEDCSCFPWIKRVVGPGFFLGDALMLGLAAAAGIWSRRPSAARSALLVLGAVTVFGLVSFGVESAGHTGVRAPATIAVAGGEQPIRQGKVFLYFFNPGCGHCLEAAKKMAQFDWGDTRIFAVPVDLQRYARQFVDESGLTAQVSTDFEKLKNRFHYRSYPYGIALDNGYQKAAIARFENEEPAATLKRLGLIN